MGMIKVNQARKAASVTIIFNCKCCIAPNISHKEVHSLDFLIVRGLC